MTTPLAPRLSISLNSAAASSPNLLFFSVSKGDAIIHSPSLTATPMVISPRSSPTRGAPRGSSESSTTAIAMVKSLPPGLWQDRCYESKPKDADRGNAEDHPRQRLRHLEP